MSSAPNDADADTSEVPRPRPLRSLAFRVNAWYVVMFIASLATLVAFAVPIVRGAMDREDTIVLESRLERHVAALRATGLPAYRAAIEGAASLGTADAPVRVRDTAGRTVFQHGDVTSAWRTAERVTGELRLEIGVAPGPWRALLERLRVGAFALAGSALLLALLGGYYLTRRGLRPVRELATTAREVIRSGDLSRRVPEHKSGDELDEVSALFNRMLARNQRLVLGMREALDNVAHDLRTPLSRLRGAAEVALRADDPAAAREALADCIEESDRVLTMLRTLMDISEAETGLMRLERAPVALARLAAEVGELYAHVAEEAGVELVVPASAPDDPVTVVADATRLRQAIANLVDNAIKYTPRGGRVTIEVGHEGGDATVRVRDTGEGIAPEALPRIWDRLYRADPSRSQRGLGLGLSLVRAIVNAHGGRVSVESRPGQGSTFTIVLPKG